MSYTTSDHARPQGAPDTLADSERHRLLSSGRRRAALEVLADRATPLTLVELSSEVGAIENGVDEDAEPAREVTIDLHHRHLPMMDGLGIVEYDPDESRIDTITLPTDATGE